MDIKLVTLTGPSGVGKTSVLKELLKFKNPEFAPVTGTTTRAPRPTDLPHEYEYVSDGEFDNLKKRGEFLWDVDLPGRRHGTRKIHVNNALNDSKIGVMILVPSVVRLLRRYVYGVCSDECVRSYYLMGVSEKELRERMQRRGDPSEMIEAMIRDGRDWKKTFSHEIFFDALLANRHETIPGLTAARNVVRQIERLRGQKEALD